MDSVLDEPRGHPPPLPAGAGCFRGPPSSSRVRRAPALPRRGPLTAGKSGAGCAALTQASSSPRRPHPLLLFT